jgi:hypothetical protein
MEPEGSSPFSHELATRPYTEPDESSSHPVYLSILILPFYLRLRLPSGLLPLDSRTKILYTSFPCMLHALPIPFSFIWWHE